MKKFKKVLALGLASVMALSVAACGGEQTGSSSSTGEADCSSAVDLTWKIGGIGPITGDAAIYGLAVQHGAQIAVDEINEAGGINGYMVEYLFEDDEANAEKSVNGYNALKDQGMQMLLGATTSASSVAVSAEAASDNMFMLTPSGSSTDIIADKTNVFQVCFTDPNQGQGSAKYIGENSMAQKVAVIYDSSEVYSVGIYETFLEEVANQPFEIVAEEAFTADSNKDFSVQLQKAKDAGAELVFLPIYYDEAALILKQARDMGYEPTFFGCDGLDGLLTLKDFDKTLAEGVMLLTPFVADAEDEATVSFVGKYDELYHEVPNQFAADSYDGAYILKAALEAANATPDMSASELCDVLTEAMATLSFNGLTGTDMQWETTGEVSKNPKAMVIKDGVYVTN